MPGPYSPDAAAPAAARCAPGRSALLTALDPRPGGAAQFEPADNMTERMAALGLLVAYGRREAALAAFHEAWAHDRLVVDKWFAVQATDPAGGCRRDRRGLTRHPDFDWRNPNRFRSLIGCLCRRSTRLASMAADG